MKFVAASILIGALVIAFAIVTTRSEPPSSKPTGPTTELRCFLEGGFWAEADGVCVMP
jgi:hypothetical protein